MTEVFNEKWMDNINPQLLLRWWRKKNNKSEFIYYTEFGIKYRVLKLDFGECWMIDDKWVALKEMSK